MTVHVHNEPMPHLGEASGLTFGPADLDLILAAIADRKAILGAKAASMALGDPDALPYEHEFDGLDAIADRIRAHLASVPDPMEAVRLRAVGAPPVLFLVGGR